MENERIIIRRSRYFCNGGIPLVGSRTDGQSSDYSAHIIFTFNGSIARDAIFFRAYVMRVHT